MDRPERYARAAREFLRALRGRRSQVQLSRWLGYASNVAAQWEGGHRFPPALVALRACERCGVDVRGALRTFHEPSAAAFDFDARSLGRWLATLQGSASQRDVADRLGASRYRVGRWIGGRAQPRLPELLALLDALTGRAADFVAALVDIDAVPSMAARWHAARIGRGLAWERPWAMAVFALIEGGVDDADIPAVAVRLGRSEPEVRSHLRLLREAALVACVDGRWQVTAAPSMHEPPGAALEAMRRHWADVARARLDRGRDRFSFNLFGVSRGDLDKIRQLQLAYFREVRAIVAASSPIEAVGLVIMQVGELSDGDR